MNPDVKGIDPAFFLACAIVMVFAALITLLGFIIDQDQRIPYREAPTTELYVNGR